jgi:hypothetical protein
MMVISHQFSSLTADSVGDKQSTDMALNPSGGTTRLRSFKI